jgi:hypothetical protein
VPARAVTLEGEPSPSSLAPVGRGERIPTGEITGLRLARFPEPLPALLGIAEPLDTRGLLVNLSRSGVLIQSERPFDSGALVRVTVTLSDGAAARMEGEVMWSRLPEDKADTSHVGLRITRANKAFRQFIDDTERRDAGSLQS